MADGGGGDGEGGGADVTAPTTEIVSAPQDGQGNAVPSVFALSCNESSCTYECSLNGSPFEPCSESPSYDSLSPGTYTFEVRATDAAGNVEDPPASHTWTLTLGFREVRLGYESACAISAEDRLYCWGSDANGALGNGPGGPSSVNAPAAVDAATDWAGVFAGEAVACASKASGELYCWGYGYPLGDLNGSLVESPELFAPGGVDFVSLDISYGFSCGLDATGAGFCIGEGYDGTLGDGDETYHYVSTPVSLGDETYSNITVGYEHACGVTTAGVLVCWGQVPLGNVISAPTPLGSDTDWASASAGSDHTCAVKTDGTLYCWGRNYSGQLGLGDTTDRIAPTQVGSSTDWVSVSVGSYTTCAVNADFETFCWGGNYDGQVGSTNVPTAEIVSPTLVSTALFHQISLGDATSCGASQDGHVLCWGSNEDDLLGRGVSSYEPSLVSIDNQFDSLALAGDQGGCGLIDDQVYCWGYGLTVGQPDGLPRATPTAVAPAGQWTAVAAGIFGSHACGIRAGVVYCWGSNAFGELGNGSTADAAVPTAIADLPGAPLFQSLSTGRDSTCAITTGNELYCWGSNVYGELGIGPATAQSSPVKVVGSGWDQISLGHYRAAARKTDGTFWNWGVNATDVPSVLPGTDWVSVGTTGFGECGIKQNGSLHCTLQAVPGVFPAGTGTWSKIVGFGYPYCALDTTGTMGCFVPSGLNGFNSTPAVATGDGWTEFEYPSALYCGLRTGAERLCRGFRRFGSFGDGFDERVPTKIAVP